MIVNVLWELRQEINREVSNASLLFILFIIIFLSPILVWPIGYIIGSLRSGRVTSFIRALPSKFPTIARILVILIIFTCFMFIYYGNGYWYIISIIFLIGAVIATIFTWKNRNRALLGRIYYSFIVLLSLLCILVLYGLFPFSL